LLAVGVSEDEIVVWSHTVLSVGSAWVQTERFFYKSVQVWQSAEFRRIGGLACEVLWSRVPLEVDGRS
jgi:hypothetical protein